MSDMSVFSSMAGTFKDTPPTFFNGGGAVPLVTTAKMPKPKRDSGESRARRVKRTVVTHAAMLMLGAIASNVTLANHPEIVPCCATITSTEISRNLNNAAAEAQNEKAKIEARLVDLRKSAQGNSAQGNNQ